MKIYPDVNKSNYSALLDLTVNSFDKLAEIKVQSNKYPSKPLVKFYFRYIVWVISQFNSQRDRYGDVTVNGQLDDKYIVYQPFQCLVYPNKFSVTGFKNERDLIDVQFNAIEFEKYLVQWTNNTMMSWHKSIPVYNDDVKVQATDDNGNVLYTKDKDGKEVPVMVTDTSKSNIAGHDVTHFTDNKMRNTEDVLKEQLSQLKANPTLFKEYQEELLRLFDIRNASFKSIKDLRHDIQIGESTRPLMTYGSDKSLIMYGEALTGYPLICSVNIFKDGKVSTLLTCDEMFDFLSEQFSRTN